MIARLTCILAILLPQLWLGVCCHGLNVAGTPTMVGTAAIAAPADVCCTDCCCEPGDCPCAIETPIEHRHPLPIFLLPVEVNISHFLSLRPVRVVADESRQCQSPLKLAVDHRQPHHSYRSIREFIGIWQT